MYTLAYAFDSAMPRGFDYELPEQLKNEIRSQRFTGCSGFISFVKNSNDRSLPPFSLYQTEFKNDIIELIPFAAYNPLDEELFRFTGDYFWADGSTSVPSDSFSESWDCPFSPDDVEPSPTGQEITSVICGTILLISLIITF